MESFLRNSKRNQHVRSFQAPRTLPPEEPDFFLVQAFKAHPERQKAHLSDPRFRGVYLLLATELKPMDARRLEKILVQHAAKTRDHSVCDEFVNLIRDRTKKKSQADHVDTPPA